MITKKRIERKEKPLYYLMVVSIIFYTLQGLIIPVIILNEPLWFIFISVLILIVISIFITREKFLFAGQSSNDKLKTRVLVICFNALKYFGAFGIIYYFCFSLLFNIYVRYVGSLGPPEFYSIPITQVHKGSFRFAPSIGFYFKEKYNTISSNQFYEILKVTDDKFKPNRDLNLECRKSIFNSYLVGSYDVR